MPLPFNMEGRLLHKIHIGGVYASSSPGVVRTVLGSCISVCLRDPQSRVGGMNHFMLPNGTAGNLSGACYGINSMELLINACMKQGANRNTLEAKVFGGGHVLRMLENNGNVPQSNIKFTLEFLMTENIPIIAKDIGGYAAREVYFFTDSGRTLLKRMSETGLSRIDKVEIESEQLQRVQLDSSYTTDIDDITLF